MKNSKLVVRSGLIIGIINVIIALLFYLLGAEFSVQYWYLTLGISLIVGIGLFVYFGKAYRAEIGGYASFKEMFMVFMVMGGINLAISTSFSMLLFQVIDTDYASELTEASVKFTVEMMENFNVPEEEIEKAVEKTRIDANSRNSMQGQVESFFWGILIVVVFSLVLAAIIKKTEDPFPKEETLD